MARNPRIPEDAKSQESESGVEATPVENGPDPNVVFVGKDAEKAFKHYRDGMGPTYKLPGVDKQLNVETYPEMKKEKSVAEDGTETSVEVPTGEELTKVIGIPFYHEQASQLVTLFPDLYKPFVKKGE